MSDVAVTTVKRELERSTSPLRVALAPCDEIVARWRRQVLQSLDGRLWPRPQRPELSSTAGLALDTRLRWWLTGIDSYPVAAALGIARCAPEVIELAAAALDAAKARGFGTFEGEDDRVVAAAAVVGAFAEPRFRAGPVRCLLEELARPTLESVEERFGDVIDDVVAVASTFGAALGPLLPATSVVCGPAVGFGRIGADADVILERCIIEVKCTVSPKERVSRALRQLLVYASLLGEQVSSAGLYLARQRTLVRFDLEPHRAELDRIAAELHDAYA